MIHLHGARIAFVTALGCAVLALGCGEPPAPPAFRIGLVVPLSGELDHRTEAMLAAAALATEEADRAAGGSRHRSEILIADSRASPEQALEAVRRLVIRDRVHGLVGPYLSRTVLHVSPFVEQMRVPLLTPTATHPDVGVGSRFVFRVSGADTEMHGRTMAELAAVDLASRRAAVLYELTDPYSRRLAEVFQQRFEELGGELVANESYAVGTEDFDDPLGRIRDAGSQVVFLPNNSTTDLENQARTAARLRLDAVLLGADSWTELDTAGIPALEGAIFSGHWHPDLDTPESRRFVSAYRGRAGETPTVAAALTYDACRLLLDAAERADGLDGESLRAALAATAGSRGVTGVFTFRQGRPEPRLVILRAEGGETTLLRQSSPSEGG